MRKLLAVFMIAMAAAVFTASPSFADKDRKGCDKKARYGHGGGFLGGEGVTVTVENTDDGVIVRYSAKKKDKIKELQLKGQMMNLKRELKELKK